MVKCPLNSKGVDFYRQLYYRTIVLFCQSALLYNLYADDLSRPSTAQLRGVL